MNTKELDYELPSDLIAQDPAAVRSESRLLVLDRDTGRLTDSRFCRLGELLRPGDCLVLNDTKVLAARFFARRATGGRLEGLFLREMLTPGTPLESGPEGGRVWEVMLKGARKVKLGESVRLEDRRQRDFCTARLLEKKPEGLCLLEVGTRADAGTVLGQVGFPPLPPYIRRDHDLARAESDLQRYQTVYARRPGAVAAPTAGLHFTEELLSRLQADGVHLAYVTLHVGAGTFKPIATENVEEHEIHHEWYRLDAANAAKISAARYSGGRILAVGTTVTRVLETVARVGRAPSPVDNTAESGGRPDGGKPILEASEGTTNLFITPGYEFTVVDALLTNFHLPRSTLLALVGAFAGMEQMRAAYRHAVAQRYRFYSYGDAMLIL
jgi:S-adenosylmethionine:tRNA ribosyltransferase-isomerase